MATIISNVEDFPISVFLAASKCSRRRLLFRSSQACLDMSTESGPGCCIHGPLSGIGGIRTTTGRLACRCSSAHTLQKRGEHSPCKPYSRGRAQQSSQRFVLGVGLASTSSFSSSPTYPAIDACRPWFGVTTPCTVSMRTGTAVAVGCSSFRVGASAVEHGALLRLGSERDWSGVRCREGGCICRPRSMLGTVTVVSPCAYRDSTRIQKHGMLSM